MSKPVLFWLAVLFVFAGAMTLWFGRNLLTQPAGSGGASAPKLDPSRKIDTIDLMERSGTPFSTADLKGQVWVANFFYSSCPSVCWQLNRQVAALQAEYGAKGVKFVSITVDPQNDTPSKLREYATRLGAEEETWFFLTGNFEYTQKVGTDVFQVAVKGLEHSEQLMVMDRQHKIRGYYNYQVPAQIVDLKSKINELLAEPVPAK